MTELYFLGHWCKSEAKTIYRKITRMPLKTGDASHPLESPHQIEIAFLDHPTCHETLSAHLDQHFSPSNRLLNLPIAILMGQPHSIWFFRRSVPLASWI